MTFRVPFQFSMIAYMIVEAANAEEAVEKVKNNPSATPEAPAKYIDDSFVVDKDNVLELNS